jgi:hypothetical protein
MKYLSVFLLSLFISFNVHADEYIEKPFSLGFGLYQSIIAVDDSFYEDDELSGVGFSLGYAISNQFALRGTFFSLDHDDFSALESTGYDITGHVGINLASYGFKAYIGGGIFKDKWEVTGFSKTFNGLQLNGGLGYNWESVSLDFILGIRDADDYEDFINEVPGDNVSASAVTGMLLLSARF